MLWRDDPTLIRYVGSRVVDELRSRGFPSAAHPGLDWIMKQIERCPNGAWEDPDVRHDNAGDIAANAVRWARRKGIESTEKPAATWPAPSSAAIAYETARLMDPQVRAIRQWLYGSEDPLFESTPAGHDQALAWLREKAVEENAHHQGRRPGKMRISVVLQVPDVLAFRADLRAERNDLTHDAQDFRALADEVEASGAQPEAWQFSGGYEHTFGANDLYPALGMHQSNGFVRTIDVLSGARIEELADRIRALRQAAGWWSEPESLGYVMCGTVPSARPLVGVREVHPVTSGLHYTQITLTLRGPTSEEEVAAAYRQALERKGYRPKRLNRVQREVLRLVKELPDATWRERYAHWLRWCEGDARLPRYSERTGAQSLSTEYRRARKALDWT